MKLPNGKISRSFQSDFEKADFSGFCTQLENVASTKGEVAKTGAYLIFVIFFTQTKILERKFYTEERVIYGKRHSRQNSVNCYLLAQANYKYQDQNYTLSVKLHTECKTTH